MFFYSKQNRFRIIANNTEVLEIELFPTSLPDDTTQMTEQTFDHRLRYERSIYIRRLLCNHPIY